MKKILFLTSLLVSIGSFAQISHGGSPISFNKNIGTAPVYITPNINVQPFIKEDKVTDLHKDIAWRFGIEQFVQLNLNNSGLWTTLTNGDRVWRLEIKSPNAKSINLNYNNFKLPVGATFFVYNKSQVLGSFTHLNNKTNSEFSTSVLKGDNVILEYYEPSSVNGQGIIEISSVVHGYRDLFNHLKGFDDSGACNVNAICDTANWGNEIRSSVMYLTSGNSRICSGALVNNTSQDGTPYVLTANHCPMNSNNIFMFNYQSPTCATNTDGLTTQTISGCTPRATYAPSDFRLVELSSVPPANYNVFYAGWSNINTAATSATGIHYPALDVKKISHDTDPAVESGYYSAGNDHWQVLDWNSGTTEGGSSGSPLFDQNHRIVGQLHGGNAACGNDASDYYGKFSYSWDTDPTNSRQLKFWLDPTNTGDSVLDGLDPNGSNYTTDAFLVNVSGIPSYVCGNSISPVIAIRNHGSNNLTSLTIDYQRDIGGSITTINWTGNLAPYGVATVNLPAIYTPSGAHVFTVDISSPNGLVDQNATNNSISINYNSVAAPSNATYKIKTDNFGSESSWVVRDNISGSIIHEGGGYPNTTGGQTYTENLCLYGGCFTLTLYDSANDGYCCSFGIGSSLIQNASGDTLAFDNTFSNDSINFSFCLDSTVSINEYIDKTFKIYPNPNNGIFTIKRNENTPSNIIVYDMLGKVIYQKDNETKKEVKVDLSTINKGVYFLSIISENERIVERLVIN